MTRDEIFAALRELVCDSLAVKPEAVGMKTRLIPDLGADSLDLIDIVFGMEKQFGIRLRDAELDFMSRLDFSSPQVMRDGFLTPETIDRLRPTLPGLAEVPDPAKVTPAQLFALITMESLCLLVEAKRRG